MSHEGEIIPVRYQAFLSRFQTKRGDTLRQLEPQEAGSAAAAGLSLGKDAPGKMNVVVSIFLWFLYCFQWLFFQ